jgi:hypothetical protein
MVRERDQSSQYTPPCLGLEQCRDGIDNDADGLVDLDDPSCLSPVDNSEWPKDDVMVHPSSRSASPATSKPSGGQENDVTKKLPQCRDGVDNDLDGFTDYPADPGCSSPEDDSEK